jgi:hypothetical protein
MYTPQISPNFEFPVTPSSPLSRVTLPGPCHVCVCVCVCVWFSACAAPAKHTALATGKSMAALSRPRQHKSSPKGGSQASRGRGWRSKALSRQQALEKDAPSTNHRLLRWPGKMVHGMYHRRIHTTCALYLIPITNNIHIYIFVPSKSRVSQVRKLRPNASYVPYLRPSPPYIIDVGV